MINVQCFGKDGRRIVPVHYSDNFFSLLPGESREVEIDGAGEEARVAASAWNVQ